MQHLVLFLAVLVACQAAVVKLEFDTEELLEDLEKLEQDTDFMNALKKVYRKVHVPVNNTWPPSFCNGLHCPKFTVVSSTKDYEERHYSPSRWVSTTMSAIDYDQAAGEMFMRLFRYISGNNEKGQHIAMTAPVTDKIEPGQGPACKSNFTRSFFIADDVKNPPKPKDSTVFLSTLPEMTVYVRSFSGFAKLTDYTREGKALAEALPDSAKYNAAFYFTAGYDSPAKFFNRHNEIWFIANQ